ncbi:hypothetical protein COCNU_13G008130 [Cocos nucifera]|uniref:NAC domain-containing protein n=1 Tax=Cocos nucifera TaxID=13894 RepID=A0A8K0NBS2_COCNU|nr:hypothetical protein COCNU_13G008130 [Cocos nucifera]
MACSSHHEHCQQGRGPSGFENKGKDSFPIMLRRKKEDAGTDDVAYFLTSRNRKYPNGKRPYRKASGGFWKASSRDKDIKGPVFGHKRILSYFIDDGTPKGRKTNWLMVEYTTPCSQLPLQDKKLDTWVVCKIYVHNREKNEDGNEDVHEDQEIGSSSHSIVHEDDKGPIEINNLEQDLVTGRQVQMLPTYSNHTNEQVYLPCSPPYANRGMVMPNSMPLWPVAWTTQYDPLRLGQGASDSQPPVILSLLPSSFTGYVEAKPSTSYASATMLISTPPSDDSITLPGCFDSELLKISKVLERNYVPPQSVVQLKQYDPSKPNQRTSNLQPPVVLPSLPSFTGCAKVGPSTSYASAARMHLSTPPSNFSTTLPSFSDLEWRDILEVLDGNSMPSQLVELITLRDPASRLSHEPSNSQPALMLPPPPSSFIEYAAVGPSASYANNAVPISNPPPDFSATSRGLLDSGLPNILEDLEENYEPLQLVAGAAQCSPSRLSQGISDSQPSIALPPLPLPFTECVEAGSSTFHASASMSTSTPPLDFSTTVPEPIDSELMEIMRFFEGLEVDPDTEEKLRDILGDSWTEGS